MTESGGHVQLTNNMLAQLHVPIRVKTLKEINANVFVTLYEGMMGDRLPDIIRNPMSIEDEIHNCQCVVDSISLDILHTSLSHITGQSIVHGDPGSIMNLVEVFSGLLEYFLDKIESDISSDNEENPGYLEEEDPDALTPEVLNGILERELGKDQESQKPTASKTEVDTTKDLIALGESDSFRGHIPGGQGSGGSRPPATMTSATSAPQPLHYPVAQSSVHHMSKENDSTLQLIRESEQIQKRWEQEYDKPDPKSLGHSHGRYETSRMKPEKLHPDSSTGEVYRQRGVSDGHSFVQSFPERKVRTTAPTSTVTTASTTTEKNRSNLVHSEGRMDRQRDSFFPAKDPKDSPVVSPPKVPDTSKQPQAFRDFGYLGLRPKPDSPPAEHLETEKTEKRSDGVENTKKTFTHHLYHYYVPSEQRKGPAVPSLSASMPLSTRRDTERSFMPNSTGTAPRLYGSTIPIATTAERDTLYSKPGPSSSHTYDNLENLMADTVHMSRDAVRKSPTKSPVIDVPDRLGQSLKDLHRTTVQLRKESDKILRESIEVKNASQREDAKWRKPKRKVSSLAERSTDDPYKPTDRGMHATVRTEVGKRREKQMHQDLQRYLKEKENIENISPRVNPTRDEVYLSDDELSQHSDSFLDYRESAKEREFATDDLSPLRPTSKKVRFQDSRLSSGADAHARIRSRILDEDNLQRTRTRILDSQYRQDLDEFKDVMGHKMKVMKKKTAEKERVYRKGVLIGPQISKYKPSKKYTASVVGGESRGRPSSKGLGKKSRKRSASCSPDFGRRHPLRVGEDNILPFMLEEFPFIHLSEHTIHNVWKKSYRQVEQLSKAAQEVKRKKSAAQAQYEEAKRRQEVLMNIMKKELAHNQKMSFPERKVRTTAPTSTVTTASTTTEKNRSRLVHSEGRMDRQRDGFFPAKDPKDSPVVSPPKVPDTSKQPQAFRDFGDLGLRPKPDSPPAGHLETEKTEKRSDGVENTEKTFTHHLYHYYVPSEQRKGPAVPSLSASMPLSTRRDTERSFMPNSTGTAPRLYGSTIPIATTAERDTLYSKPGPSSSHTYDNLENLMADTVHMSRDAVRKSPIKSPVIDVPDRLGQSLKDLHRTTVQLRKESNKILRESIEVKNASQREDAKWRKPKRKVSSLAERSTDDPYKPTDRGMHATVRTEVGKYVLRRENQMHQDLQRYLKEKENIENISPRVNPNRDEKYLSDDELSQHSDSFLDYRESAKEREFATDDLSPLRPTSKKVRFQDSRLSSGADAHARIRSRILDEDNLQRTRTRILDSQYRQDLDEFKDVMGHKMKVMKKKTAEKERVYRKGVLIGPQISKYKPSKKYTASVVGGESRGRPSSKGLGKKSRKRSASCSPDFGRRHPLRVGEDNILPFMLEEFPFIHLSEHTIHDVWKKSYRQVEQLSKAAQEVKRKKSAAQAQYEEAKRRQEVLMNIMKKELSHNQKMQEVKERRAHEQAMKAKIREKRMQSARARRYYDDYQVRMRSRMLKKRTKEEMIFKKLFKEGLEIQKERLRDLRSYAKEQREVKTRLQQNEIESLENFYRDQFAMLAESMAKERKELQVREKAQEKVLSKMKGELRKKMETEIREFQEQLYRDEDDVYYRQLDADRVKHDLQVAQYHSRLL
ncbi:uncharacterized protein LOC106152154 [Lingula anatina]|uniref:Uncharacterized protein LOC106152154 n=2 Tax=Lingula anatina TaxID=7574 RepID=A0A1S3H7K8_LINAN|nr:uncharacterized protein LOC106152154 [Lingula anatina]|eukprot:XP_013381104.1 uncharacterized protein LOC106152154 [Lingula anatina]